MRDLEREREREKEGERGEEKRVREKGGEREGEICVLVIRDKKCGAKRKYVVYIEPKKEFRTLPLGQE